jgi:hypothetical protein
MYKAWNPFARLPTSPSKRILMLAPVAVGSESSRPHHRLPIAAGLTGKSPFDNGTSRDKYSTSTAPHEKHQQQQHPDRQSNALESPVGAWVSRTHKW